MSLCVSTGMAVTYLDRQCLGLQGSGLQLNPTNCFYLALQFPLPVESGQLGRLPLCEGQGEGMLGQGQKPLRERQSLLMMRILDLSLLWVFLQASYIHFSSCCNTEGVHRPNFLLNCGQRGTNVLNGNIMLVEWIELGCQVTFKQVFFSRRRYIRPEFLAGKGKTQRSQKCQVYDTVVADNSVRQANETVHMLSERNAAEKHSSNL